MSISYFCLLVIMFEFPKILIVVSLCIIIISLRYNPSFVTCLIQCKLIYNRMQPLVFVLYKLTYVCRFPLFVRTPYLIIFGYDCAHFLFCQTADIFLLYLQDHNYLTYSFLNHSNSSFLCFYVCAEFVSFNLSCSPPQFLFCFCVLLLSLLFYNLNFTLRLISTAS